MIPPNTPSPMGRTESRWPGISKAEGVAEEAAEAREADSAEAREAGEREERKDGEGEARE